MTLIHSSLLVIHYLILVVALVTQESRAHAPISSEHPSSAYIFNVYDFKHMTYPFHSSSGSIPAPVQQTYTPLPEYLLRVAHENICTARGALKGKLPSKMTLTLVRLHLLIGVMGGLDILASQCQASTSRCTADIAFPFLGIRETQAAATSCMRALHLLDSLPGVRRQEVKLRHARLGYSFQCRAVVC